jgi:hypothetical protein
MDIKNVLCCIIVYLAMSRKICEKSIYNVLLYCNNSQLFNRTLLKHGYVPGFTDRTLNWTRTQAYQLNKLGFDVWYNKTDGPLGISDLQTINKDACKDSVYKK